MIRCRARLLQALTGALLLMPSLLAALPPELERYFQAIRQRESAGHPWSIFDNTAHRSYRLGSRAEAEKLARELVARGHNLDLGLYQLNWHWQGRRANLTLDNVFDPAVNESVARSVFAEFHAAARAVYASAEDAIRMAVGAYNNGKVRVHNPAYVNGVFRLAGLPPPYAVTGDVAASSAVPRSAAELDGQRDVDVVSAAPSRRRAVVAPFDDDADAAEPPAASPTEKLLLPLVLAMLAVAALLIALVVGLKLLPWLLTSGSGVAKRALVLAALRAQRHLAAQTARLAQRQ